MTSYCSKPWHTLLRHDIISLFIFDEIPYEVTKVILANINCGLNQSGEDKERLSNPDLRKARFDLLFKEYEEEFERLSNEVNLLKTENEVLQQQLQRSGGSSQSRIAPQTSKQSEANGVLVLNKKLQDAQKLYEKVKSELSKVKQENNSLKDENVNLNRENQKLRQEIANRSPHRYGRYTVATLESKVKDQEKEMSQLNKALERSDKLIEDLQKEVEEYRGSGKNHGDKLSTRDYTSSYQSRLPEPYSSSLGSSTSRESSENHKRQLFTRDYHGDDEFRQSSQKDYVNGESSDFDDEHAIYRHKSYDPLSNHRTKNGAKGTKRVTFDLPKDKNETVSFDLEMPSPFKGGKNVSNGTTPSPVKGVLKNGKRGMSNGDDSSFNLSKPGSLDDSYSDDRRMASSARYSKDQREEDALVSKYSRGSRYSKDDDEVYTRSRSRKSDLDISGLSESFNLENPSRVSDRRHDRYSRELDDTEAIENELDDLDISLTPDFTDCMKLLNRAEKKVHSDFSKKDPRDEDSLLGNLQSADDFLSEYKPSQRLQTKSDFSDDFKPPSRTGQYSSLPDSKYLSKYYPSEDYKPSSTSMKSDFDIPSSRFSGNSDPISSRYQTSVIPNSSEFKPSASRDFLAPSNKTSDTISNKYPLASDKYATSGELPTSSFRGSSTDNFNIPSSSTEYSASTSDFQKYKLPSDAINSGAASMYNSVSVSTPSKYSSAALSKPLGQSVFSRSPSLDNLYMQSKTTQSLGSRFATAEDIPSDFRGRSSLPLYDIFSSADGQGRLPSSAATHTNIGNGKDYISSALSPKPVRIRSQSDMGTSVSSFASSSTHSMGKGNIYASASTGSGGGGINNPNPPYEPASQYLPPPSTSQRASNMLLPDSDIPSNPSLTAPFMDSARFTNTLPSKLELNANSAANVRLTNGMTNSNGPMKATAGYSYTDFDLGVNPRHKSKTDLPLTSRTRSNSLDIPMNLGNRSNAMDNRQSVPNSQFSNSNSTYAFDRTDIDRPIKSHLTSSSTALTNHDTAYAVSLTGASSGPVTMETNPGTSRYGSTLSSSSTYLTTSLTSVTSSNTYSAPRSTSAPYPSSSTLPTSTYTSQNLKSYDPEPSGKGYMYLSNTSSLGDHGDGSRTDSFLPEPKKRLFDSTDDMDMSLSPIKATKTS
ncbi:hypothetical protein FSP39_025363 [Pinctada imbricata]|uniref:Uncharacterized protein n=1 Tax=Pinctada imbricata TaxID=66713 RepID=A0AA89C4J8_PINIB|nr:hypothetical protein FSP39_025363 [Pinctada imbricata]